MAKFWFIVLLLVYNFNLQAQVNLVPNPSFEQYVSCPNNTGQVDSCVGWYSVLETPDYYNTCAPYPVNIPNNVCGYQNSFDGFGYMGLHTFTWIPVNYREIIGAALIDTIVVGNTYNISMRVSRGNAVSVLMIDVDRFKTINDTHGHQVGDAVLQQLGARMKALVRGRDVVARLGGEELGVVLPDTALEGARLVAQRVLEAARGVKLTDGRALTVSVGVAQWQQGERGDALMSRADQALYAAKSAGRDRAST